MLERGYTATTVDEIVATAGVAKGSFYHFFESKEALGLAALEAYFRRGRAIIAGGSFREVQDPLARALAFVDHVEAISTELWEHGCLAGNFATEVTSASPAIASVISGWFAQFEAELAAILEPVAGAARIEDAPSGRELAAQLLAVIEGAIIMGRARGETDRLPHAIREFRRYLRSLLS